MFTTRSITGLFRMDTKEFASTCFFSPWKDLSAFESTLFAWTLQLTKKIGQIITVSGEIKIISMFRSYLLDLPSAMSLFPLYMIFKSLAASNRGELTALARRAPLVFYCKTRFHKVAACTQGDFQRQTMFFI